MSPIRELIPLDKPLKSFPFIADLYATTAVIAVAAVVFISASLMHVLPLNVKWMRILF